MNWAACERIEQKICLGEVKDSGKSAALFIVRYEFVSGVGIALLSAFEGSGG